MSKWKILTLTTGEKAIGIVPVDEDGNVIIPGGGGTVTSVFGRTGIIVAAIGDYTKEQITGLKLADIPTFAGLILSGSINIQGGQTVKVTTVNAATYSVLSTDYDISVTYTATAPCAITIPADQNITGRTLYIADDGGNATVNNITIYDDAGTPNILFTIDTDDNVFMLRYNGTDWRLR